MKYYITTLERALLESLKNSEKDIETLFNDLDFDKVIIVNLLHSLLAKNLIKLTSNQYYLNNNISKNMISELQRTDSQLLEIKEIIGQTFKSAKIKGDQSFKLKKISMSNKDLIVFKSMLSNIDSFLTDISKKSNKMKTCEQQVIFWGVKEYSEILNEIIEDIGA